ncbi:class B sortase [Butyrivibrio hungatei]|uniref:Sortase family protein n=1 Tax=Butyrivibrio hungatei TaxID=185008 RepID=A0A1D9P5J9_9FIRM|nr:class B sortase [Butyrivibrio hungatei]AOZ97819.1 sortase family protein [Butyrivibrio hungatei]
MATNDYYKPTKPAVVKTQRQILKEKELNKKLLLLNSLIVGSVVLLVFAVVGLLKQKLLATAAETTYEVVADNAVKVVDGERMVDFSVVKSEGSTSTSWLYLPDTAIDYPLVQGNDNETYLGMDAYGNESDAGAIFINFANSSDMSDVKTIIFGHNMANGSMFTDLHKYSDKKWGDLHQNAYIYMDSGEIKHYRLLYYIFTQPTDEDVYVVSKMDVGEEEAAKLKDASSIVYNEYSGGNMICLSTCTMHKYRTVVVFEYVDGNGPIRGIVESADSET